jgi:RTX calcium-binding nonapeptide repeat (4 copies)
VLGPGANRITVSGRDQYRVLLVGAGASGTEVSRLTLADGNSPDSGGAIRTAADLTVSESVITGSAAVNDGGGIYAYPNDVRVENSTISGNTATDDGGGLYAYNGEIEIVNSTVSGNSASGVSVNTGGGLWMGSGDNGGTLNVRNSTVSDNRAENGGGVYGSGTHTSLVLAGSLIAGSTATGDGDDLFGNGFGDSGVDSAAFNLIGDPGNSGVTTAGGNLIGVDPLLSPLADNGGPTPTRALKPGSPAKDAGPTSGAPATDQRGSPRKGRADIGAYELVKCGGTVVDVVGTSGKDRLRGDGGKNGILGLGGNDRLAGLRGRDALCGKGGKDKLSGGNSKDKLLGGGGTDKLKGGKAADKLNGGPGNDQCIGGSGPGLDKLKSC